MSFILRMSQLQHPEPLVLINSIRTISCGLLGLSLKIGYVDIRIGNCINLKSHNQQLHTTLQSSTSPFISYFCHGMISLPQKPQLLHFDIQHSAQNARCLLIKFEFNLNCNASFLLLNSLVKSTTIF